MDGFAGDAGTQAHKVEFLRYHMTSMGCSRSGIDERIAIACTRER